MGKRSRQKRQRRQGVARVSRAPDGETCPNQAEPVAWDDAAAAPMRVPAPHPSPDPFHWPNQAEGVAWDDGDGLHMLVPGQAPDPDQLQAMSQVYQQKIRQSGLWHEMVRQFGAATAEEMLKDFRIELR